MMIVEIKVPELGESINEIEVGEWLVELGDRVRVDDEIVALESDKATVEIPAPAGGSLVKILKQQGESALIGEVIGHIDTAGDGEEDAAPKVEPDEKEHVEKDDGVSGASEVEQRKARERFPDDARADSGEEPEDGEEAAAVETPTVMPAAARVLAQHDIAPETVQPTGPGGRILKEDALRAADESASAVKKDEEQPPFGRKPEDDEAGQRERRVAMTPIRRTIAAKLVDAQRNMALLTTFNEADMTEVKNARAVFGREFEEKHGVRLGFMSFFVKAAVAALNDFPLVNARIDGKDIVYHDSCDIGVAIGGGKGLVVPVLRRAERMSFAGIEKKIGELADKAKKNSLTMDELQGGTFTISNGGIYGSMLSTPIVNPPQSAILGLHAITDRPVAIDGEILIRPIMYLALSYDHRIIDGREAVSFLKSIKSRIEEPRKLLLEI